MALLFSLFLFAGQLVSLTSVVAQTASIRSVHFDASDIRVEVSLKEWWKPMRRGGAPAPVNVTAGTTIMSLTAQGTFINSSNTMPSRLEVSVETMHQQSARLRLPVKYINQTNLNVMRLKAGTSCGENGCLACSNSIHTQITNELFSFGEIQVPSSRTNIGFTATLSVLPGFRADFTWDTSFPKNSVGSSTVPNITAWASFLIEQDDDGLTNIASLNKYYFFHSEAHPEGFLLLKNVPNYQAQLDTFHQSCSLPISAAGLPYLTISSVVSDATNRGYNPPIRNCTFLQAYEANHTSDIIYHDVGCSYVGIEMALVFKVANGLQFLTNTQSVLSPSVSYTPPVTVPPPETRLLSQPPPENTLLSAPHTRTPSPKLPTLPPPLTTLSLLMPPLPPLLRPTFSPLAPSLPGLAPQPPPVALGGPTLAFTATFATHSLTTFLPEVYKAQLRADLPEDAEVRILSTILATSGTLGIEVETAVVFVRSTDITMAQELQAVLPRRAASIFNANLQPVQIGQPRIAFQDTEQGCMMTSADCGLHGTLYPLVESGCQCVCEVGWQDEENPSAEHFRCAGEQCQHVCACWDHQKARRAMAIYPHYRQLSHTARILQLLVAKIIPLLFSVLWYYLLAASAAL